MNGNEWALSFDPNLRVLTFWYELKHPKATEMMSLFDRHSKENSIVYRQKTHPFDKNIGESYWLSSKIGELVALSIQQDFPVYYHDSFLNKFAWGHLPKQQCFFASSVPWKWELSFGKALVTNDEMQHRVVSTRSFFNTNFEPPQSNSRWIFAKMLDGITAKIVNWDNFDVGFQKAWEIESMRGLVAEGYQGFEIRYLPSKRFGMRYGAYAQGGTKAIAIEKSLAEAKQAINKTLGIPPEPGAAVLGGKSPGPGPYDAVLGGKTSPPVASSSTPANQAEIILPRPVANKISVDHCWGHRGSKYFGRYPATYEIDYSGKQPKLIASKDDMPIIMIAFGLELVPPHPQTSQSNCSDNDNLLDDDWEIIED